MATEMISRAVVCMGVRPVGSSAGAASQGAPRTCASLAPPRSSWRTLAPYGAWPRAAGVSGRASAFSQGSSCALSRACITAAAAAPRRGGRRSSVLVVSEFEDSDKMHVPSDSFSGMTAERKSAQHLKSLFTFVAVRIVLYQLEGVAPVSAHPTETDLEASDSAVGSSDGKLNTDRIRNDYQDLFEFYQNEPMGGDADEWVGKLMGVNKMLAVRILEVRKAYAEMDFDWTKLQALAMEEMEEGGDRIMKESLMQSTYFTEE